MKRTLIRNLSANTFQLIINQLFGLVIFYLLSTGLDKESFGQINLALAILLAVFNLLSFGIDQFVVKKIAAGDPPSVILSLYICHVLLTGLVFYGLLFSGTAFFDQGHILYRLLLLIGVGKLMIFFSTPFKQAANGLERFRLLAYMSVVSNLVRCCGLVILAVSNSIGLHNIILVFIGGDVAELLLCIYLFKHSTGISLNIKWDWRGYKQLLHDALPQAGVVLITSALARFDWIFIGFVLSSVKLAEYSFAYKIFEISTLPLLAIAPLLIPRFTKLFQQKNIRGADLKFLVRIETIISAFTALLINVCWSPVIDTLTSGKYGAINVRTIFILSLCMPLLYLNNFLWTIYFAQGRLKMILNSFIIILVVNIAGDILLVPVFKNEGAAMGFLASCVVQTIYYMKKNDIKDIASSWYPLIVCTGCALFSGILTKTMFHNGWLIFFSAIFFYFILLLITSQIQLTDRKNLKQLLNW